MRIARYTVGERTAVGRIEGNDVVGLGTDDPIAALRGVPESGERHSLADVSLLAPIVPRRNVMCVGWNYLPHFEEGSIVHGDRELPDRPTFFSKTTTTVIGPTAPIPSHSGVTSELDYEVELGVVIGHEATGLTEENALDVVVGYVVANDISARDLQKGHGGQWYKGKSLDGTCPVGPLLVSADEVGDPQDLDIECRLNDEVMQSSNTKHMIFPIRRLLTELSQGLTLLPGDLFLSGTPEGVGMSRTPPRFLRPGDVLESTVAGLGTLRNEVV